MALKLIKAGMDTREVVARFESERHALALMDHPAIAKVFDAGSTAQGRPFFVMEYVVGMPITDYCDKHKLTTRERLELFIHVCQGVQHAHQKAIIHRDLKPSNILVGEVDGKPMPKIIDFGVAKATAQRLTAQTMFTRLGSIVGTPEYMSPEQAGSAGEDIDTRTDVYSLGVVLYELLVGALPLDFHDLRFDEVLNKVRDEDASKPSTKLRTLGEQSTTAARNRSTEPRTLARLLRGDLDAITLKAIEKQRSRRYGSPSELAEDVSRYLCNRAVSAHPPSAVYRAGKYIRRHWAAVAVAAAAAVLLVSFSVAQYLQVRRVTRERDRADRVTALMTSMFKVSNPSESRGNKVTAREILDKAAQNIGSSLTQDPQLQAQMMRIMGVVYTNLGIYPQAHPLLLRAMQIQQRVLGPNNPETLNSAYWLGLTLLYQGHYRDSERLERQTFETQTRVLGPENRATLLSMHVLAWSLEQQGRFPEAEQLYRKGLDIERRTLGPDDPQTLSSMKNLANCFDEEGHPAEAEPLQRELVDVKRRVLGPEHPDTLSSMNNLANAQDREGHHAEAVALHTQVLAIRRRILGPEHPYTLWSMDNLAVALAGEGHYAEAEKLQRETLDLRRRVLGPDHPDTARSLYNLAGTVVHLGRNTEALSLLRQAADHGMSRPDALDMANDSDFQPLRSDPRFAALVAYAIARTSR